jgi:hypothetical protein
MSNYLYFPAYKNSSETPYSWGYDLINGPDINDAYINMFGRNNSNYYD